MAKKKAANEETPIENTAEENEEVTAEAPVEEVTAEQSKMQQLEEALSAEKDKYLRLAAEYDNFRKRSQKEREAMYGDVMSDTILKLLPVYDNLARALAAETEDKAFYKGVEMTMTQLRGILEKMGVTEIEALGKTFDPAFHNAVMHIDDDNYGESEVVEEFERGFKLGDRVIRFSVVKVAN